MEMTGATRSKPTVWTSERNDELERLVRNGYCDRDIGKIMGLSFNAVRCQRIIIGLSRSQTGETARAVSVVSGAWPKHLRFENVTKDEARRIRAGAPPSGRFTRHRIYSEIGCTAGMCAETRVI